MRRQDSIFGIPEQTLQNLKSDLKNALSLEITHLSIYNLTFESDTKLNALLKKKKILLWPLTNCNKCCIFILEIRKSDWVRSRATERKSNETGNRGRARECESKEKLKYDLYYIKNLSVFLDISILASTARTVILGNGAR